MMAPSKRPLGHTREPQSRPAIKMNLNFNLSLTTLLEIKLQQGQKVNIVTDEFSWGVKKSECYLIFLLFFLQVCIYFLHSSFDLLHCIADSSSHSQKEGFIDSTEMLVNSTKYLISMNAIFVDVKVTFKILVSIHCQ